HVWFEGLDSVEEGGKTFSFGGSIPLEKALLDRDAVPGALLATTMNDQPLTADHGFPARMVVPGYIGARSVKWLSKIVVSDRPSPASEFCWQLWSAEISANSETKELIVRAIDSRGEAQPENVRWNAKGYLYNGWHHVSVK